MSPQQAHHLLAGATALVLASLAVAACGGSGGRNASSSAPPKTATQRRRSASNENLGKILVNSRSHALPIPEELRHEEHMHPRLRRRMPPLRRPASRRRRRSECFDRRDERPLDGKPQVTYHGHPLYLYSGNRRLRHERTV